MMQKFLILLSGAMFGAGLTISGMVNPMKILNFLDVTGNFDPTLIVVMGGALITTIIGYRVIFARAKPFFDIQFYLPSKLPVDFKLIAGAVLFGLGWGISGFCPGPAVASLVFGYGESILFVAAMIAGTLLTRTALRLFA